MAECRCGKYAHLIVIILVALFCVELRTVDAHSMKLFASREDQEITGFVYFAGGDRASGVEVVLKDADERTISRSETDEEGEFAFEVEETDVAYEVKSESADGHHARFSVPAQRETSPRETAGGDGSEHESPHQHADDAGLERHEIQRVVEKAVERKIRPLREELAQAQSRTRWQDVLGGIGYILGLFGVAYYFKARSHRDDVDQEDSK